MSAEHKWRRKCFVVCLLALFIGLIGIVLPEIVFTPRIYINATNITTVGAASTSSTDIFNISEIDDFNFSLVESTTPWYINITFTNITNFSYLETKSMYFATTGAPSQHEVDIEMWCETDQNFVDLSSLTSHIEWFYFTRNFPDSTHFIDSAGNVTVRFNHSDAGNVNHRLYIDTVRLITSTQYEQVNINQTIIGGDGCTGDCAFNNLTVNSLGKNNTLDGYVSNINLLSPLAHYSPGDIILSQIDISDGYTNIKTTNTSTTNYSNIYKTPELLRLEVTNANNNFFEVRQEESVYDVLGRLYTYNTTHFDMGGANLTNCANCGGNQNLSQVLSQGNKAINQSVNFTNGGSWLTIGYNNITGLMEINTSSIVYYKQAGTLIGFQGGGSAYSAYDNKQMKFGESGTNYSSIVHNATYGTTWQARGTANNNLNITGFDKVNMYQDADYNENNLSKVYNIAMNITNGSYNTFTMLGSSSTPFFTAYENGTMRHEMTLGGTQIWKLRGADSAPAEVGYIAYSTPGSNPGIAIFNSSLLNRIDIASTNNGFEFYVYPNASSVRPSSPALVINRTQKIVIPAMAGAGDAYVCVDANGALFRKASTCA